MAEEGGSKIRKSTSCKKQQFVRSIDCDHMTSVNGGIQETEAASNSSSVSRLQKDSLTRRGAQIRATALLSSYNVNRL